MLNRKDRHYEITYHKSVVKETASLGHLHSKLTSSYDLFHMINLPIALKSGDGKKYELIGRYWVLQYLLDQRKQLNEFPVIVFEDERLLHKVLEIVTLENDYFQRRTSDPHPIKKHIKTGGKRKKVSLKKSDSKYRSTKGRRSSKATGRTCPFCPGPLVKATGKEKESQGNLLVNDGPNKILCGYRKIPRYMCSFVATLTDAEYRDFLNKDIQYPTGSWIQHIAGETCPDCGGEVYKRVRHNQNGTIEEQMRCRKQNQSKINTCYWTTAWRKSRP